MRPLGFRAQFGLAMAACVALGVAGWVAGQIWLAPVGGPMVGALLAHQHRIRGQTTRLGAVGASVRTLLPVMLGLLTGVVLARALGW